MAMTSFGVLSALLICIGGQASGDASAVDDMNLIQMEPRKGRTYDARFTANISACTCDFRELQCLPTAECMAQWQASQRETIALGVGVRSLLKKRSRSEGQLPMFIPIGKAFQAGAIRSWQRWVETGVLFQEFNDQGLVGDDKLDWKKYPFCKENNLQASKCFFGKFGNEEELEGDSKDAPYPSLLEQQGFEATEAVVKAFGELENFRRVAIKEVDTMQGDPYLRSFAYLLHNSFSLNPSMKQVYKEHAGEINPGLGDMKVSLHIRRADSCSSKNYQKTASKIDSGPQMTNVRMCYDTDVYMNALRHIKALYQRPLTVYLSSDDNKDILEGIKSEHPDIFSSSTWRFIDYPRDLYKYSDVIEGGGNHNKAFMSETAVQDLWHMSHGEAFVGHLGSRFGKVGYLLAVSRQNSALPYVSVDGHSICCEIDEQCSRATQWMDNMADCLTFSHENHGAANVDYWQKGSTVREREKKKQRNA